MSNESDGSDPANGDPAIDAVVAAPRNHKVIFENEGVRFGRRP